MRTKGYLLILAALAAGTAFGAEPDRGLRFSAPEGFLPPMTAIAAVKGGAPGPGAKDFRPVASVADYKDTLALPGEGPFDVWWQPREGKAVRVLCGFAAKEPGVKEIKLATLLGVVRVRGDKLPRASLVVVAPQGDPGPDEKGHFAVQMAPDYRAEMAVPEGFYSVWIKPANGARAQRVEDRVRVLAGKRTEVE